MALPNSTDRGELRSAIEGLLRACAELDRGATETAERAQEQAHRVAAGLAAARLPGSAVDVTALAQQIDGVGQRLRADLGRRLAEAQQPYVAQVHALLGLLAPLHGLGPVPALPAAPGAPAAALDAAFPAGFARDYVADILAGVRSSATVTRDEAAGIAVVESDATRDAIADTRSGFADDRRSEGVGLLAADECHAVERHGPQIPGEAQLARLLWLKDPTGEQPWQIDPTGAVITEHWAGTGTGGFTSAEALAKPLQTLLDRAHAVADSLDAFLTGNLAEGTTKVLIHVPAADAGLVAGDALGYEAAGAGTKETRRDWIKARQFGLGAGRTVMHALPYDPIAAGDDPGATIALTKTANRWRLTSCYPVGRQNPSAVRLEDIG